MAKKNGIPAKYQAWIDARKRFHLPHAHIQMARELGMNPKGERPVSCSSGCLYEIQRNKEG